MAPALMLDTHIVSIAARQKPSDALSRRIRSYKPGAICISIVTAAEVRFGLEANPSVRARQEMERLLGAIPIIPFDSPADEHYGRVRAHLAARGRPIGPNDLFIAAHALAIDATLITRNTDEFSRVPGLRIENWLD
jgi:tRNA(fMet)-specific endonuclease VapC